MREALGLVENDEKGSQEVRIAVSEAVRRSDELNATRPALKVAFAGLPPSLGLRTRVGALGGSVAPRLAVLLLTHRAPRGSLSMLRAGTRG
jgi:hypothetical protein